MNITIPKSSLSRMLARVMPAVSTRPSLPILGCVLLDAHDVKLCARSSNTFTNIATSDPCSTASLGAVAVNAKLLADSVSQLPEGDVTLKLEKNKLTVRGGKVRLSLPVMPGEDFPPMPAVADSSQVVEVKAPDLVALLKATSYAASNDDTRPHLAAVNLEAFDATLRAVCTDGHRLATSTCEHAGSWGGAPVLVPENALTAILKLCDKNTGVVSLTAGAAYLFATSGDTTVAVAMGQETFPPYSKVIPKSHSHRVGVNRAEFIAAIKACAVMIEKVGGIRMELHDGSIRLSVETADRGESDATLDVDYAGDGLTIGFNHTYMIESLNSFASDEVYLEMSDALSPIVVVAAAEPTLCVIMPMRCG